MIPAVIPGLTFIVDSPSKLETSMAQQAGVGDTVLVHYKGVLSDGTVFDSSEGRDPLEFEVGGGEIIGGFDRAVQGMEVGERKEITVPAEQAYGPRRDDLEVRVGRDKLPDGFEPQVGGQIGVEVSPGRQTAARISEVEGDSVTLDLNHPLAGEELSFEVELVEIR